MFRKIDVVGGIEAALGDGCLLCDASKSFMGLRGHDARPSSSIAGKKELLGIRLAGALLPRSGGFAAGVSGVVNILGSVG